jgi:hypothetical protein
MVRFWLPAILIGTLLGVSGGVLRASEVFPDGDMGSLDGWEHQRLPFDFVCEVTKQNSPFKEVFEDNGSSLLVSEVPGKAHQVFLLRQFDPVDGKFVFSFDFRMQEGNQEFPSSGFALQLQNGNDAWANFVLRERFHVNQHLGSREESRWHTPMDAPLQLETWYHLRCEFNIPAKTFSGTITSEHGEQWEFSDLIIPEGDGVNRDSVDGLRLRAGSGPDAAARPTLVDNISLRRVE